jgi:hypothetical protein
MRIFDATQRCSNNPTQTCRTPTFSQHITHMGTIITIYDTPTRRRFISYVSKSSQEHTQHVSALYPRLLHSIIITWRHNIAISFSNYYIQHNHHQSIWDCSKELGTFLFFLLSISIFIGSSLGFLGLISIIPPQRKCKLVPVPFFTLGLFNS